LGDTAILGQMRETPCQVCNHTRRQIELTHRCPHQALTFSLQLTKLSDLPDTQIDVTNNIRRFAIAPWME
jgi:hypothetical protein